MHVGTSCDSATHELSDTGQVSEFLAVVFPSLN